MESVLEGAVWAVNGSIYRLESCPTGYEVLSAGADGEFDGSVQECRACGRGEECTLGSCRGCSLCEPGHLKDSGGGWMHVLGVS